MISRCRGQALVETLLASLLLVPMLLAVLALGDWQRAAVLATQAARFTALATSLTGQMLSAPQLQFILSAHSPDPAGDLRLESRRTTEPVAARRDTRRLAQALAPVQRLSARRFALEQQAWLTAQAEVDAPVPRAFQVLLQRESLQLPAQMTLLVEDGALASREQLLRRLQPLAAMTPVTAVMTRMRPVAPLLGLLDPSFNDLCFNPPDPDLLPVDRLRGPLVVRVPTRSCP